MFRDMAPVLEFSRQSDYPISRRNILSATFHRFLIVGLIRIFFQDSIWVLLDPPFDQKYSLGLKRLKRSSAPLSPRNLSE